MTQMSSHNLEKLADQFRSDRSRWFLWFPVLIGFGIALYFALPIEPGPVWLAAPLVPTLG